MCKQLKTKNMKTSMKQLAAGTILGLLLLAVNVRAEGKEVTKASSLENSEATLELENWMIDETVWNIESSFIMEESTEESLVLEDWMISNETWNNIQSMETETELESLMELECWMTDSMVWNR